MRSGCTTRCAAPTWPTTTGCSTSTSRTSCSGSSGGGCGTGWPGFPAQQYIRQYERDNRSVWLQELELTPAAQARAAAVPRVERASRSTASITTTTTGTTARPACATRSTGSSAARCERTPSRSPSGTTYRFHTQRLTANDALVSTGLLLALGPGVDRPITAWEEMFLPLKMREHVRRVTVPGPDGTPRPAGPVRADAVRIVRPAAARESALVASVVSGARAAIGGGGAGVGAPGRDDCRRALRLSRP